MNRKAKLMKRLVIAWSIVTSLGPVPHAVAQPGGDRSSHASDHAEDLAVETLPMIHVHGLRLNKDQQLGPVPKHTPWPALPSSLQGHELDDWMKARLLVTKDANVTVVVLEPAKHRELTLAGLTALKQWTFDPQMKGDDPVDGEVTIRIHFRTQ